MVKNSRNHFWKLLINSPFDLEILALKHVDKITDIGRKTSLKTLLKNCWKQSKGIPIYRPPKTNRWGLNQQSGLLAVDRSVDRLTVRFLTVEPAVDWPVDRCLANSPAIDRPVDLAISREQRLSGDRPCGRPVFGCARLCTSVNHPVNQLLARSTCRRPAQQFSGIKNLAFYI